MEAVWQSPQKQKMQLLFDPEIPSTKGWRDDSVTKSTDYAYREPGFYSQYPYTGLQSICTSVPRNSCPFLGTGYAYGIEI